MHVENTWHSQLTSSLFNDDDILKELENHHTCKTLYYQAANTSLQTSTNNTVGNIPNMNMDITMNAETSDYKVSLTFGKGSNTAGPDGISATMIDKTDRELMRRVNAQLSQTVME